EKRHENKIMRDREVNQKVSLDNLFEQMKEGEMKDLNIIIKGDAQGSVEALAASLMKIDVEGGNVRIIHTGVGAINELAVSLATYLSCIIIRRNGESNVSATVAEAHNQIDTIFDCITYTVFEDIKFARKGMLDPEFE